MAGKHVVVTGASSGIGAALVAEFVRSGDRVTMVARREAEMRALAAELPGQTQHFVVDLSKMEDALAWIAQAEASFGNVDVFIHNAGVQLVEPAEEHDPEALQAMLRLNLLVPLAITRHILPAMLARGSGTIVDVASVAGLAPTPGMWGYNASKAGLGAASESLRGELRNTGVHVVTVYPGPVDTPMARAGYAAYPESAALSILPEGRPAELARRIRTAVDLRQARGDLSVVLWPAALRSNHRTLVSGSDDATSTLAQGSTLMRVVRDAAFDRDRIEFALRHCCEDCGMFVVDKNICGHEWPTDEHRRQDYEKPTPDILFCKEFELA